MDALKTLHLHIGSGRCGTTLIQGLFEEYLTDYDPAFYLQPVK